MRARATLTLKFADARTAKAIVDSVPRAGRGYTRARRSGATITAAAAADGPMSLLHTLDDYLACVSVAERTTETARPRRRR